MIDAAARGHDGGHRWKVTRCGEVLQHDRQASAPVGVLVDCSEGAMWAQMRIHLVRNEILSELGYSSKLNAEWEFISMLHRAGRSAAETFLADNGANLGKRSSVDLDVLLQGI